MTKTTKTTIDLYAWPTPNAHKISIMLEETGLQYNTIPVNIGQGDQFKPEFLKISPNNKMPALVDHDGPDGQTMTVFESGAILMYLAEKTGKFMPKDPEGYYTTLQWLMWQMAGFGPMLGQAHHFRIYAPERVQYAYDRYTNEAQRLYKVLDNRLAQGAYLASDQYTIADMAVYPWALHAEKQGVDLSTLPNVQRWMDAIGARPAVQAGLKLLEEFKRPAGQTMTDQERENMFGKKQYAAR